MPSRNHLGALLLARRLSEANRRARHRLSNFDRFAGACVCSPASDWLLKNCRGVLDRKLSYSELLSGKSARHKIVLQLDTSFVPGQVAGDALLCRVPCVGGNGAVDRLAFPETCGFARSIGELGTAAQRLLIDKAHYKESVIRMEAVASQSLAFKVVAKQLGAFFR